jgi:flavin reductase (DIM6/NTAB) family NADH-FMN oxidoreductase RutF
MDSHTVAKNGSHSVISPAILYVGTPVVVISSENEDGTCNLAPMSSAWWLGHSCMLGLDVGSKTTGNILRTRQCVLNIPDDTQTGPVNALAGTTGSNPVSASKQSRHYVFVHDKWTRAGLTPQTSDFVRPTRVAQFPLQMECGVVDFNPLRKDLPDRMGLALAIEVRVLRVHIADRLRMPGHPNRVDPDRWRPLIMSFQEFFGLRDAKVAESVLGRVPEEEYRAWTRSDVKKLPGDDDDELHDQSQALVVAVSDTM